MNTKNDFVNELLQKCLIKCEKEENITYRNERIEFVRKYFANFNKIFNDLNVKSFLLLSERDVKIVRTRFGIYNNGECQTLDEISKLFNMSRENIRVIIKKFTKKLTRDIENKLCRFVEPSRLQDTAREKQKMIDEFTNKHIAKIEELNLTKHLNKRLNKAGINTLGELLNFQINQLPFFIVEYEQEKLVNLIHLLGLKFNCELNTEEEKQIQNKRLDEIRLIGLKKYMDQNGSPKYLITMIKELEYETNFFMISTGFIDYLNYHYGITTIEKLLKLSEHKFNEIFKFIPRKDRKTLIDEIHNLGYKFDFEIEKENNNEDKISEIYKKKLDKLKKIQAQIEKLQLEQAELILEIEQLSNQQQLGDNNGIKK